MTWNLDRRIRHIDRPVSPLGYRGMRLQLLKMDIRKRRGIPNDAFSWDIWQAIRGGKTSRSLAMVREALRTKRLPKQPKSSLQDTRIFRWKRMQQWIAEATAGSPGSS
jgi:hypothetical protein